MEDNLGVSCVCGIELIFPSYGEGIWKKLGHKQGILLNCDENQDEQQEKLQQGEGQENLYDSVNVLMMQQQLGEAQDQDSQDEFKLRPLTESQPKLEPKVINEQPSSQTIFRINEDILQLQYQWANPAYKVNSHLLNHTKIRPQDREKLKSWMLSETQNLYERQTYCHASKYLDMFFMKGQRVQRNAFQALGLACLILAAKVNERRVPSISFQVFDRNQIFNFERSLLEIFNFRVNPVTYVSLTQSLLYYWDHYQSQKNPFKTVKYYQPGAQCLKRVRSIMETLDCIDLVHDSLDIPLDILVFTVFYVEHRRICLLNSEYAGNQTDSQHKFSTIYHKVMKEFLNSLKSVVRAFIGAKLSSRVLVYSLNFSRINPKIHVNPKYKHFMFQISRQTYNPQITLLAQNFIFRRPQ